MTNMEIKIIGRFLDAPKGSWEELEALAELIGLYDARRLQYIKGETRA